jgi:hypothetical protein
VVLLLGFNPERFPGIRFILTDDAGLVEVERCEQFFGSLLPLGDIRADGTLAYISQANCSASCDGGRSTLVLERRRLADGALTSRACHAGIGDQFIPGMVVNPTLPLIAYGAAFLRAEPDGGLTSLPFPTPFLVDAMWPGEPRGSGSLDVSRPEERIVEASIVDGGVVITPSVLAPYIRPRGIMSIDRFDAGFAVVGHALVGSADWKVVRVQGGVVTDSWSIDLTRTLEPPQVVEHAGRWFVFYKLRADSDGGRAIVAHPLEFE